MKQCTVLPSILSFFTSIILVCACQIPSPSGPVEPETVRAPSFSHEAGNYASTFQLSISCETSESSIRYTIDGSDPIESSLVFSEAISIDKTLTVKARAWKNGMNPSDIVTAIYTFTIVSVPVFSMPGGTYTAGSINVGLSCATIDSAIYYTTNGNIPTTESTLYVPPHIAISNTSTITAKAFKAGCVSSESNASSYTFICAAPGLDFISYDDINGYLKIAASCETPDTSIRWTRTGSDPIETDDVVPSTGILEGVSEGDTIKIRGFHNSRPASAVVQNTVELVTVSGIISAPRLFKDYFITDITFNLALTDMGGNRVQLPKEIAYLESESTMTFSFSVIKSDYDYYLYCCCPGLGGICDSGFYGGTGTNPPVGANINTSHDTTGLEFDLVPNSYPTTVQGTLTLPLTLPSGSEYILILTIDNDFSQAAVIHVREIDTSSAVTSVSYSTSAPSGNRHVVATVTNGPSYFMGAHGAENYIEAQSGGDAVFIPVSGSITNSFDLFTRP